MNIQRLEMMKQMLGRVVAGSWSPVTSLPSNERFISPVPEVKVKSFDLKSWTNHKTGSPGGACGFSACAVGHACFDEEFRKMGWRLDGTQPRFNGLVGWPAVERFFDIREDTAENLFMNKKYSNIVVNKYRHLPPEWREAQMVLDRIDLLMQYNNESTFNVVLGDCNEQNIYCTAD